MPDACVCLHPCKSASRRHESDTDASKLPFIQFPIVAYLKERHDGFQIGSGAFRLTPGDRKCVAPIFLRNASRDAAVTMRSTVVLLEPGKHVNKPMWQASLIIKC